jgi:phage tail sheath gpL-like
MPAQIPITGVPLDFRVPGAFAEILFNQGQAAAFAPGREVVFVMPMSSAGGWTANTKYRVSDEGVARAGAGAGSPLHRALSKYLSINPFKAPYAVPYAATSGGSPVAATATATFSGTVTAAGTLTLIVAGEAIPVGFASGATFDAIAALAVLAINAKTHLPVTASYATPVLTLTAKIAGASQGTASIFAINVHREIAPLGTGLDVALSGQVGSGAAGADGTTTEAANFATALATLSSTRLYYMGTSLTDATSLGHLQTHITAKSLPSSGLRSVGVAANRQAETAAATIATAKNYERLSIWWMENSEHDPAELVGAMTAILQMQEEIHTATNFDSFSLNNIILPAYADADIPTPTELNDAINDGLSPIMTNGVSTYMVYAATTRSKDATGALDDPRSLERHRVSVADEWTDQEIVNVGLNYRGKRLAPTPLLANGKVDWNKVGQGPVNPEGFKPHIVRSLEDFREAEKLQNIEKSKASLRVIKTGSRLEIGLELNAIDLLHQETYRIAEVSTG